MATIVYQEGLQKCLDSQLNEPRILRLKLASPKPHELTNTKELEETCKNTSTYPENKQLNTDPDMCSWSFLQDLDNNSKDAKPYVHLSTKVSSPKLSEKSLEMCTEDLGSETGTITTESNIFSTSLNSTYLEDFPIRNEHKSHSFPRTKKVMSPRNFPPPLTTLSGSESLELSSHRVDGGLVIEAIRKQSNRTSFHAERTDGRLRLCMLRDNFYPSDYESDDDEEMMDENEHEHEDEDGSDDEYCSKGAADCDKDMDVEAEVGTEKCQMLSRCNERQSGSNIFFNWEPCCMATS